MEVGDLPGAHARCNFGGIDCPAGGLSVAARCATSAPIPLKSVWEKSDVSAVARGEPPPTTVESVDAPGVFTQNGSERSKNAVVAFVDGASFWTPTSPGEHSLMAYQTSAGGPIETVTVNPGVLLGPGCISHPDGNRGVSPRVRLDGRHIQPFGCMFVV